MTLFKSLRTDSVDTSAETDFLLRERISPQWYDFLQVLSEEMRSQLSGDEYRELLKNMGVRMAGRLGMGGKDTIEQLEDAINQQLGRIRWGYVKLQDSGNQLQIQHFLNPLLMGLDADRGISGGFLEGMYEEWFRSAGADGGLSVKQNLDASTDTVLEFHFGRHA